MKPLKTIKMDIVIHELPYLQKFESRAHVKAERIDYLDCYHNYRIKVKLRACHLRFIVSFVCVFLECIIHLKLHTIFIYK